MNFSSRSTRLFIALGAVTTIAGLVVACGSDDGSTFKDPSLETQFGNDGSFNGDVNIPQEDLYKNDPLPSYCGPEAGGASLPPPVTGSEECPDDKNKPGCFCEKPGTKAACWTGLRKHRNLGICKDGVTTCQQKSENTYAWGPCEGQVLPDPNATEGAPACKCFSVGQWKIANLSPCTAAYTPASGTTQYATVSTLISTGKCPVFSGAASKPGEEWSTDTLKVDCAGTFKLKYRIRHGNFDAPDPNNDCIVGEVELPPTYYPTPNVEMPWPNLPGWIGGDPTCSQKWAPQDIDKDGIIDNAAGTPKGVSPGYGEMIVLGESVLCDKIDDGKGNEFVFNRIKYCPSSCNDDPSTPDCVSCQASGQGEF
jgi:hypothetical protein